MAPGSCSIERGLSDLRTKAGLRPASAIAATQVLSGNRCRSACRRARREFDGVHLDGLDGAGRRLVVRFRPAAATPASRTHTTRTTRLAAFIPSLSPYAVPNPADIWISPVKRQSMVNARYRFELTMFPGFCARIQVCSLAAFARVGQRRQDYRLCECLDAPATCRSIYQRRIGVDPSAASASAMP